MAENFYIRELANGLTLLGQRIENVSSAAMTLLAPAGVAGEKEEHVGSASVLAEWLLRGAGDRDTRALNDLLDSLGCQHSETVLSQHMNLSAAQLGRNLPDVLGAFADIVRRPRLEEEAFETCRALALQDLEALEDEPAQKCNLLLRENFYPYPLGRNVYGREETLAALTAEHVRELHRRCFIPRGAILAVAGAIDWPAFVERARRLFEDWTGPAPQPLATQPPRGGVTHVKKDSAQEHIALAFAAPTIDDRRYYAARVLETILSGGMSSRLFTEVREKRGLVYHVSLRYHSLRRHAGMFLYAGTTPEKAQQTFDVAVQEIRRLAEGVTGEEMARARTQLKSAVIMQEESTAARAGAIAGDWYHLGRLRGLAEISAAIDAVTAQEVVACSRDFPPRNLTILHIGPQELNTSG